MKKRNLRHHTWMLSLILTVVGIIWLSPIIFSFFTSFKTAKELKLFPKLLNIAPLEWSAVNYAFVWDNASIPVLRMIVNSLAVSLTQVVLVLFVASTSAYAYERLYFKGKETLFWCLFALGILPGIISLVPQYILYDSVGWTDTLWVLITPYIGNVFNIFLLRNFLHGVPYELDEAARIDGANDFVIYSRILLPTIFPAMAVVALFTFAESWNDLMWPSLAVTSPDRLTITAGIRLLNNAHGAHPERVLAACMISIIPTILVYLTARKDFLTGLTLSSGIKG